MQVTKLVVHSVDNNLSTVVLSNRQINLNQNAELDALILKFYKGILNSTSSSDALILEESRLLQEEDIALNFMQISKDIAQSWFDYYQGSTVYTALNLIFALLMDEEKTSFVMFEVNTRSGFVRTSEEQEVGIEYNPGILSDSIQGVKTAFIYELNEKTLKVKHNIDSQELLEDILKFETIPNTRKSLEIIDAMVDYVSTKREEDVLKNTIATKQMILDTSELFEEVEPKRILENVFEDLNDEEEIFINETMAQTHMSPLLLSKEVARLSARKKHRLETENGIVINLPIDSLKIESVMEIIENPDGSKDLVLKNIGDVI